MKSLRSLLALALATVIGGSVALAGPREPKRPDAKPEKGACCVMEKEKMACCRDGAEKADKACCLEGGVKAGKKQDKAACDKVDKAACDKADKPACPPCAGCK